MHLLDLSYLKLFALAIDNVFANYTIQSCSTGWNTIPTIDCQSQIKAGLEIDEQQDLFYTEHLKTFIKNLPAAKYSTI